MLRVDFPHFLLVWDNKTSSFTCFLPLFFLNFLLLLVLFLLLEKKYFEEVRLNKKKRILIGRNLTRERDGKKMGSFTFLFCSTRPERNPWKKGKKKDFHLWRKKRRKKLKKCWVVGPTDI